jgi:hypothetical protein
MRFTSDLLDELVTNHPYIEETASYTDAAFHDLSLQQREYLLAAYQLDQLAIESSPEKLEYLADDIPSVAEWRWLPFGFRLDLISTPATQLWEACQPLDKLTAEKIWQSLNKLRLLETKSFAVYARRHTDGTYSLPHIRLTNAGRKLARTILGQDNRQLKKGEVSPATWKALVGAWQAGMLGVLISDPLYGGELTWNRLQRFKPAKVLGRPNVTKQSLIVIEKDRARLTQLGLEFYLERWESNTALYPGLGAPSPVLSLELKKTVRHLMLSFVQRSTHKVLLNTYFEQWSEAITYGVDTFLQNQLRVFGPAVTAADILGSTGQLRASLQAYLLDRLEAEQGNSASLLTLLRRQLSGADFSCWQLWRTVELVEGRPAHTQAPTTIVTSYSRSCQTMHISWSAPPLPLYFQVDINEVTKQTFRNKCRYWVVDFSRYGSLSAEMLHWFFHVHLDSITFSIGGRFNPCPLRVGIVVTPEQKQSLAEYLPVKRTGVYYSCLNPTQETFEAEAFGTLEEVNQWI